LAIAVIRSSSFDSVWSNLELTRRAARLRELLVHVAERAEGVARVEARGGLVHGRAYRAREKRSSAIAWRQRQTCRLKTVTIAAMKVIAAARTV
jgi:hypothetical protein